MYYNNLKFQFQDCQPFMVLVLTICEQCISEDLTCTKYLRLQLPCHIYLLCYRGRVYET